MKKFLSLAMACALTASLLAGCGTTNNAPMENDKTNTPASDNNGATGNTVTGDGNNMDGSANTTAPSSANDGVVGNNAAGVPDTATVDNNSATDKGAVSTPPTENVPNAKP
ncbi:MAG: hypothetical protein EOM63_03400 [Clostridia bacterium]|nr:hypothetical protein [Clostridia bacterium]